MKRTWSASDLLYLKKHYPKGMSCELLAKRLNKTADAVKSKAHVLGLLRIVRADCAFTPEQIAILIERYPNTKNTDIAKELNTTESAITAKAFTLRLRKSPEFIRLPNSGQFKPGSIPVNKGKKMSPEVFEKSKNTFFKKGHVPGNSKASDGVITIRHEHPTRNNGRPYKYIRLSLGKWQPYHKYIWEKKHGSIPKGMCLWFKDGDSLNCTIDNLELITRAENMSRNTIARFPEELRSTIHLVHKVKRKIKKIQQNGNKK